MEQHCLRPVAKQDNESAGVLVAQPFEKPAEPTCGITRCHYFVECELFHRVSPWAASHAQALASPADFFALRDRAGGAAARLVALKLALQLSPLDEGGWEACPVWMTVDGLTEKNCAPVVRQ